MKLTTVVVNDLGDTPAILAAGWSVCLWNTTYIILSMYLCQESTVCSQIWEQPTAQRMHGWKTLLHIKKKGKIRRVGIGWRKDLRSIEELEASENPMVCEQSLHSSWACLQKQWALAELTLIHCTPWEVTLLLLHFFLVGRKLHLCLRSSRLRDLLHLHKCFDISVYE